MDLELDLLEFEVSKAENPNCPTRNESIIYFGPRTQREPGLSFSACGLASSFSLDLNTKLMTTTSLTSKIVPTTAIATTK